jgi:hypothetical protein
MIYVLLGGIIGCAFIGLIWLIISGLSNANILHKKDS